MKKVIFFLVPIVFIFLFILYFVKNDKIYTSKTYAIWVPRFEYSSIEDVHKIIKNCAELGLTDILFQVRGMEQFIMIVIMSHGLMNYF